MTEVRRALRRELESRDLRIGGDTVASRNEIYVEGDGDLAAALFAFPGEVRTAIDTMYQGHWIDGLPPRFAVLPTEAASDPHFELLEQMRILPLLYECDGETITFLELDAALEQLRR